MRRWLYRYADAVTANSHGALKSMESYVPKSKLFFVPNPVSFPSAPDACSRREKIVLNVGRLTRQKAQDVLLKAFARVAAEMPEWRLAIVGYGRDARTNFMSLASSSGAVRPRGVGRVDLRNRTILPEGQAFSSCRPGTRGRRTPFSKP